MKSYINNESGIGLVAVLLVMFFITVTGFTLLTVNINSMKLSKNEEVHQSVYYIAEAGLSYYTNEINKLITEAFIEVNNRYNLLPVEEKKKVDFELFNKEFRVEFAGLMKTYTTGINEFNSFSNNISNSKKALVNIEYINEKIIITSTGLIDDKRRTIRQEIAINSLNTKPISVEITEGTGGNSPIQTEGELNNLLVPVKNSTEGTPLYLRELDSAKVINGKFKYNIGEVNNDVSQNILPTIQEYDNFFMKLKNETKNNLIEVKSQSLTVTNSATLKDLGNFLNNKMTIDIKPNLQVTNIYIDGNANVNGKDGLVINVHGDSKKEINIIIDGDFNINGGVNIQAVNGAKINLIVKNNMNFNNNGSSNAFIDADVVALNTTLQFSNSANAEITGNFITTSHSSTNINNKGIVGGICAPNSKLDVNGKLTLNGSAVFKAIGSYNGGASLDYQGTSSNNPCKLPQIINGTSTKTKIEYYDFSLPDKKITLTPSIEV